MGKIAGSKYIHIFDFTAASICRLYVQAIELSPNVANAICITYMNWISATLLKKIVPTLDQTWAWLVMTLS